MSNKGFSHIGLSTLDLDKTRAFYEDVLGFKPVVADTLRIAEGGRLRHIFFDVGRDQLLAFMEAQDMPGVPAKYEAGINRGLGVPAAFYHFAFEAGSEPNGLSLEYCCLVRELTEDDALMQERGTIPRAALEFNNATGAEVSRVQSARGKVMA